MTLPTSKEAMTASLDLPLGHLLRSADPAVKEPWLLFLLHGVGSNEKDLFGLAPQVPPNFHVISLRAPNTLGPGAYAWFEFRVTAAGRIIDEAHHRCEWRNLIFRLQQPEPAGKEMGNVRQPGMV